MLGQNESNKREKFSTDGTDETDGGLPFWIAQACLRFRNRTEKR
jgi:hypothetical protein